MDVHLLEVVKTSISNQYAAALCTLGACINRCPESSWDAPVVSHPFCRMAFHTLFFADYYLEPHERTFRGQPFHLVHAHIFRDYEELEYREPKLLYERASVKAYLEHCRNKVPAVIDAETAESLAAPCGFPRKSFSRAELHVYNIRHIQHHAAQMSLRLRIDFQEDVPWFGSGWRDA